MFSFRDFLPERSSDGQPVSLRNIDIHDSTQLRSLFLGSLLVLTGSALRRSILGLVVVLSGASMLHRNLRGGGETTRTGRSQPRRTSTPQRRPSPMSQRTPGGGVPDHAGTKLVRSIIINRPHAEIFQFVRNLENAPSYLKNVESVQILDDRRSHWTAHTSEGGTLEWYLEIINEHPGEMIAWQSLQGSDILHAGSIRFENAHGGNRTLVKISLEFAIEESEFMKDVASILGQAPEQQLIEDLSRLKFMVESGSQSARVPQSESMV